ncbi:MAG: HEAT repeat domain-containing protein [Rubripirellula sp.]
MASIASATTGIPAAAEPPSHVAGQTIDANISDLDSSDRVIRLRAVRSLGVFGAAASDALRSALDHDDPAVRYLAAEQLGEIGDAPLKAAKPQLEQLAADESSLAVQMAASFALCRAGDLDKHLPLLIATLDYPERGTACSAAALIGKIGPEAKQAVAPLEAVHQQHRAGVKGGDYHRGGAAMNALRKISDKNN